MANTRITDGDNRSRLCGSHMVYICSCNIDARWLTHGSQMGATDLNHMGGRVQITSNTRLCPYILTIWPTPGRYMTMLLGSLGERGPGRSPGRQRFSCRLASNFALKIASFYVLYVSYIPFYPLLWIN